MLPENLQFFARIERQQDNDLKKFIVQENVKGQIFILWDGQIKLTIYILSMKSLSSR